METQPAQQQQSTKSGTVVDATALFALTAKCKLHPVVVFSILDHFSRRNENQERVVGTLLGVNNDGVIEIKNSYPVLHNESGALIGIDREFHRSMFDLNQKANRGEVIVGWYTTGSKVPDSAAAIHDFFWREVGAPPVVLLVDTDLTNAKLDVSAFVGPSPSALAAAAAAGSSGDAAPAAPATPAKPTLSLSTVQLEFSAPKPERLGLAALSSTEGLRGTVGEEGALLDDLDSVERSMGKLIGLLDEVTAYVQRVIEGKETPNVEVGRLLYDTLYSLPKVDAEQFETLFSKQIQDLVMIVYLSKLTRTHLTLNEKLQSLVQ